MMNVFDITRTTRKNVLKTIEELSVQQLNKIPEGHKNNIIWHVGHILATQQLLTYGVTNTEMLVSMHLIEDFRKGTEPYKPALKEDIEDIKQILTEVIDRTEEDYNQSVFSDYEDYTTSYGVTLHSLEEAIIFNNVHEALHLGIIMTMKKLV